MTDGSRYRVRQVDWRTESEPLRRVRRAVFIEEQRVPEALEWDEWDERSVHLLACAEDGEPIGTGRLLPDGSIGRMAVMPAWRGLGVGGTVLAALVALARQRGVATVRLSAQTRAIPFYARFGFEPEGPEYLDAGIVHRLMSLRLR
jgi:predicted GNAT family N-acyltransferase